VQEIPRWKLNKLAEEDSQWVIEHASGYFCKFCKEHNIKSPFGGHLTWISSPCVNQSMAEAVRKHKTSDTHKLVLMHLSISKQQKSIDDYIIEANDKLLISFNARIRDVFWLFKHHLPLRLAKDMLDLATSHGAFEQARALLQGPRQKYSSNDFFSELQLCIANVIRLDVLNELKDRVIELLFLGVKFLCFVQLFGLSADEALDVNQKIQLLLYLHYFCRRTFRKKVDSYL